MRDKFYYVYATTAGQPPPLGTSYAFFATKEDAINYAKTKATADRAGSYDHYVLEAVKCIHRESSPIVVSDVVMPE